MAITIITDNLARPNAMAYGINSGVQSTWLPHFTHSPTPTPTLSLLGMHKCQAIDGRKGL